MHASIHPCDIVTVANNNNNTVVRTVDSPKDGHGQQRRSQSPKTALDSLPPENVAKHGDDIVAAHSIGSRRIILKDLEPRAHEIERGANKTGHQPAANARGDVADAAVVLMMLVLAFFVVFNSGTGRSSARHSFFASSYWRRKRSAKKKCRADAAAGRCCCDAIGGAAAAHQQPKEEERELSETTGDAVR